MATRPKKPTVSADVRLMPVTADGQVLEGAGSWPLPVAARGDPRDEDDFGDETLPSENATDRVMAMLDEVGGDDKAVVKVYRKRPDGKNVWLDDYSPLEFENGGVKMMRQKYGGGSYVIFLYGMTPRGAFGIRTKAEVEIEATKESEVRVPVNDGRMDRLEALVTKMLERPPVDPMMEMQKMFAMAGTMREAFGLNNAPQKSGVTEALEMMREMRAAAGELMPERESSDEGGLLGMAKGIIPLIGAVVAQQQAGAAPMTALPPIDQTATIAPNNGPLPPGTVQTQPEGEPMSAEMLAMIALKGYIKAIVMMAKTGVDPQKGADIIYKHLPDEMIGMMELPVWWELLIEQAPDLKPYQEWVTKARDLAMAQFAKEAAEAPPEE